MTSEIERARAARAFINSRRYSPEAQAEAEVLAFMSIFHPDKGPELAAKVARAAKENASKKRMR